LSSVGESRATILLECVLISARLLYNRSKTTIPVHLRVLGKLLTMEEPSPLGPKRVSSVMQGRLMRYVIATCFQKIRRRVRHKTLSQPLIKSLKDLTTFNVGNFERDERSDERTGHDRLLLEFLMDTHDDLQAQFPKLLERAKNKDDPDFDLYTEDTCAEFHKLFKFLLKRFQEGLDTLHQMRGDQNVSTRRSKEFKTAVETVFTSGYALQRLAHGAALRVHMKAIASKLPSAEETSANEEEEEEEEEGDEDLELVQPYAKVNGAVRSELWQSHIDWLRLILVQFDAVDQLVHYFAGDIPRAVSIYVVTPPSPNFRLLRWQKLLEDPRFFPTTTTSKTAVDGPPGINNDDILNFFTEHLSNVASSVSHVNAANSWWNKRDLGRTISRVEDLKTSTLPGWGRSATDLLDTLNGLPGMPESESEEYKQISFDIKSIQQHGFFYSALASTDYDNGFGGALHCEAFLASILCDTANISKDLAVHMQVGHFSSSFLSPESHFL